MADCFAQVNSDAAVSEPRFQMLAVQRAQAGLGNFDNVCIAGRQESVDDDLASRGQRCPIELFTERAGENHAPKQLDGGRRLALLPEPRADGRAREIVGHRAPHQFPDRAADSHAIGDGEVL